MLAWISWSSSAGRRAALHRGSCALTACAAPAPAGICSVLIALPSALLVKSDGEEARGPKWSLWTGGGMSLGLKSLLVDF